MRLELDSTEREIITKHDSSVRARAILEMLIVCSLIEAAEETGHFFKVEGKDAYTISDLKRTLFNLDEATLLVYDGDENLIGWIRLVFGNDGYDLISDYSTNLEEFLKPVNKIADFWSA